MNDDPPDSFYCPISLELMRDPVCSTDGHTYDRKSIDSWFKNQGDDYTSPSSGLKITSELISNLALKASIEEHEEAHSRRIQRSSLTPLETAPPYNVCGAFGQATRLGKSSFKEVRDCHSVQLQQDAWIPTGLPPMRYNPPLFRANTTPPPLPLNQKKKNVFAFPAIWC